MSELMPGDIPPAPGVTAREARGVGFDSPRLWREFDCEVVEAAGIEPASKSASATESTGVSRGLSLAQVRPAGGLAFASPGKFRPFAVGTPARSYPANRRPIQARRPHPVGRDRCLSSQCHFRVGVWLFSNSLTSYWSSARTVASFSPVETLSPPRYCHY